jgi:hypothetical protein
MWPSVNKLQALDPPFNLMLSLYRALTPSGVDN